MAANTDLLTKVGLPGSATTLASPGHTIAGTSITVDSTSLWPTDTGVVFGMDTVTLVNGEEVRDVNSYTVWEGVVTSATGIGSMVLKYGTDQNYPAGSTTRVYILPSVIRENQVVDWGLEEHDQDGTHSDITATSITATTGTFDSVVVSGTATSEGWSPLGDVPDTITANGNRNYDIVFNGVDHTSTLSPGMKMQLTRTVAAPDQCADLEASSSQYFNKTSPSGAIGTMTDDYTCMAWIKPESYSNNSIVSKLSATNGFVFSVNTSGQVDIRSRNSSADEAGTSYASVPLNKWTHVAATMDASGSVDTIYIDGQLVSSLHSGAQTAFVQGGNLEVGSANAANFFDGKLAQVAVFNAVLSAATIRSYMSQGLSGSETSCVGAWSLDNSLNDLSANANNLTANGGAAATATDSPFANAVAAGLLEYAEVNSVTFSTNTTVNVRVPETCQIPTSGGVSAVSYSTQSNPYGLPYFSKVLGMVLYQTAKATTSTSVVQVEGLSVTQYLPANTRVMIVAPLFLYNLTASKYSVADLYIGTVGSGTKLGDMNVFTSATASAGGNSIIRIPYIAQTAGSVTFNIGIRTDGGGGTANITGSATAPSLLSVELV